MDVRPNDGPLGLLVAVERLAKLIGGRLVVVLREENLSDSVVGQRAVAIDVERVLILLQRFGVVAQAEQLLALANGDLHANVVVVPQDDVMRVEDDALRFAESLDGVVGGGSADLHGAVLGFALGLNLDFNRHPERVHILLNLAEDLEALAAAKAVDGVLLLELRGRRGLDPLQEEGLQMAAAELLGDLLDIGCNG